jgi:hypothetical protein
MTPLSYSGSGHEFPPDIIQRAVWAYLRFALSFRDVEELLVPAEAPKPEAPIEASGHLELPACELC